ncbi:MAG: hypothetical protein ABII96_10130 [Candidatus Zixiibacteriota bacterium]
MPIFFELKPTIAFLLFILLDLLCVGMGMGVPIFCILFGFVVGWYIAKRISVLDLSIRDTLHRVLKYAITTSLFTLLVMCVIWGRTIILLFDPASDFKNFGIPMILYEPKASFIGWLVLMIFISPFLQLLTTIFASYLTLQRRFGDDKN